eukprot:SAG31_NODE_585_length_13845_cov_25.623163_12_plen_187_part_00
MPRRLSTSTMYHTFISPSHKLASSHLNLHCMSGCSASDALEMMANLEVLIELAQSPTGFVYLDSNGILSRLASIATQIPNDDQSGGLEIFLIPAIFQLFERSLETVAVEESENAVQWLHKHPELLEVIEHVTKIGTDFVAPAIVLVSAVATAPGGLAVLGKAAPLALSNVVSLAVRCAICQLSSRL